MTARLLVFSFGAGLLATSPACGPGAITVHTEVQHAPDGIVVSGRGEAVGSPDVALLQLGASVLAASASDAVRLVAARSDGVLSALSSMGIDRKDIQTVQYEVNPEYGREAGSARVTGYRATQLFRVTLDKPERAGEAVDAASRTAGDAFVTRGVTFDLKHRNGILDGARDAAWKNAHEKAVQLARLAGVRLGSAEFVEETVDGPAPRPMLATRGASDFVPTPMEPGQVRLEVNLRVRFSVPRANSAASPPPSPYGPNVEVLRPR